MSDHTPRKRLGRPVDPEARAERARLIRSAARRCFLRSGFHAAGTAEISREAGVSVANMYQYYSSKEDLVLALVEEDLEDDLAFVGSFFSGERFLASVENALRGLAADAGDRGRLGLRAEIFAEALRNERVRTALARSEKRLVAALAERVEAACARNEITLRADVEAEDLAVLLYALADGVYSAVGLGLVDGERFARRARALLVPILS